MSASDEVIREICFLKRVSWVVGKTVARVLAAAAVSAYLLRMGAPPGVVIGFAFMFLVGALVVAIYAIVRNLSWDIDRWLGQVVTAAVGVAGVVVLL